MGMYTELILGCSLKRDTPAEVIQTIRNLVNGTPQSADSFKTTGRNPLRGGSYYFGVISTEPEFWFDDIRQAWILSSRGNIKNYEREIESFLTWLQPYIDRGSGSNEMYAIVMYEEATEPTIYYLSTT